MENIGSRRKEGNELTPDRDTVNHHFGSRLEEYREFLILQPTSGFASEFARDLRPEKDMHDYA